MTASVIVIKKHNAVFAQVAARRDLDDLIQNRTGVSKPVHFNQCYVSGLIFNQRNRLFSASYFSRTVDHNPLLCSILVLLQIQTVFGLDMNAFDLKTAPLVNAVIPNPLTVHFAVQVVFFGSFCVPHPFSEASVETFNKSILLRLAWVNVFKPDSHLQPSSDWQQVHQQGDWS